jgi:hypothetical protein
MLVWRMVGVNAAEEHPLTRVEQESCKKMDIEEMLAREEIRQR